ncbi:hypothetical protein BH10PSE4_BH10PSE4_47610 [soil metagenome]
MVSPATCRTRWKNGTVLGGSLLLHAAILAALGWPVAMPFPDRSNDDDALSITLERTTSPPRASPEPVARLASPLHPRPARLTTPTSVAPLVAPIRPGPPRPSAQDNLHPAPLPEGPRGDLRKALRGSGVGCANERAVGLNRRELEHCDERLGALARNAPVYDAPMDAGKRRGFEAQALRQQADRAYRDAPMGIGVDHRSREGPGTMKDIPWVGGAEQDGLGRPMSATQQRLKHLQDADKAEALRKKAARESE